MENHFTKMKMNEKETEGKKNRSRGKRNNGNKNHPKTVR